MMSFLTVPIALLSSYCTYISITSARDVKTYESKAEQAASVSKIADKELQKTRETETYGVLASAASLITSLILVLYPSRGPWLRLAICTINGVTVYNASDAISRYWRKKSKVPGLNNYNDAITLMIDLARYLFWCSTAWYLAAIAQAYSLLA